MKGPIQRAGILLAAALLLAPALFGLLPPAGATSELFKTSKGELSAELAIRSAPGYNDTLAFTLPSESSVLGARFDLAGSPARLPAALEDSGAGLQNGSSSENLAASGNQLSLSELPGSLDFSAWEASPACGTAVAGGELRLALDGAAMLFGANARVFATNQPEYDPALAVGADDTVHVAWTDQSEYDFNIYTARSLDGGATFSAALRVNLEDTGKTRQEAPDIATGPGGRVYVAWTDNRSGSEDIFLASSSDGGASFSADRRVDDGPPGTNASFPSIAVLPSGRVAVAWEDTRSGDRDVRCAFSSDGISFGQSLRINTDSSGREQFRPRLAAGNGDLFHVVWYDNRSGDFDIYYARTGGGGFLPEKRVDDSGDSGSFQALPSVAVGPDERVHVVWHDRRYDGYRVVYSGSADGIVFSPNLMVSPVAGAGKDQFQPRVRAGADGTVHVAWHDRRTGYPHIFYANSTSAGKTFGASWPVDDAPRDTLCYSPSPGVDSTGAVHIAWWDNRTRQGAFGTNFQIFHARGANPYYSNGEYLSPVLELPAAPSRLSGALAENLTPPNTSMAVQLATSPGDSGPWSGFGNITEVGSPSGPPAGRYLLWKVRLSSRTRTATPSLSSLRLEYQVHPASGELVSRPVTFPYAIRSADVYLTEGRSGDGPASLTIALSSNNGSTWQEARPGLPFQFGGAGRVLRYRVQFNGSSSSTPTLAAVSLNLQMESLPSDIRMTVGRPPVTVWSLPGQLGGSPQTSPDLRDGFNRQVQEARRASQPNATVRFNISSATPGTVVADNIRISFDLPPVLSLKDPSGPAAVEEGGSLPFGVVASDPDSDPLTSRWLLDGYQVETGAMTYLFRPDFTQSGVHNLTVVVSDGVLTSSTSWLVTVTDVNRPPVLRGFSPETRLSLRTGESARFEVEVFDPDGSPLLYAWSADGGPAGSGDSYLDYVAPKTPGLYSVTVDVSDGRESVNRTWVVEVYRPSGPPDGKPGFPLTSVTAGALLVLAAALAVAVLARRRRDRLAEDRLAARAARPPARKRSGKA